MERTYLGDGLYGEFDGYHIALEAGDMKVFLEPDVLYNFEKWVAKLKKTHAPYFVGE